MVHPQGRYTIWRVYHDGLLLKRRPSNRPASLAQSMCSLYLFRPQAFGVKNVLYDDRIGFGCDEAGDGDGVRNSRFIHTSRQDIRKVITQK